MFKNHRRRNSQIQKQFQCTQGCGKSYGSYAALYTHIKKKHSNTKPPDMKVNATKNTKTTGRKGRPFKYREEQVPKFDKNQFDCKICNQEECICVEELSSESVEKTIRIMSEASFLRFTHYIGTLGFAEGHSWVRNSEDEMLFMAEQEIEQMVKQFNKQYSVGINQNILPLNLSQNFIEYLSFSSRYWDTRYVVQLYKGIFACKWIPTFEQFTDFVHGQQDFIKWKRISDQHSTQIRQFFDFVKFI